MSKPIAVFLIGLPASGKSTWAMKFLEGKSNWELISLDNILFRYMKEHDFTYEEAFQVCLSYAAEELESQLVKAIEAKKNLVWDQLNITMKQRVHRMKDFLKGKYECQAVYFPRPGLEEWHRRLNSRDRPIPKKDLENLERQLQKPEKLEGFSKITVVGQ